MEGPLGERAAPTQPALTVTCVIPQLMRDFAHYDAFIPVCERFYP